MFKLELHYYIVKIQDFEHIISDKKGAGNFEFVLARNLEILDRYNDFIQLSTDANYLSLNCKIKFYKALEIVNDHVGPLSVFVQNNCIRIKYTSKLKPDEKGVPFRQSSHIKFIRKCITRSSSLK